MAHLFCPYSQALESCKKCSIHCLEYWLSHRISSRLEKKIVQLPCVLTAGKELTYSGAGFNRGNEFMLATKAHLNLQLRLSI